MVCYQTDQNLSVLPPPSLLFDWGLTAFPHLCNRASSHYDSIFVFCARFLSKFLCCYLKGKGQEIGAEVSLVGIQYAASTLVSSAYITIFLVVVLPFTILFPDLPAVASAVTWYNKFNKEMAKTVLERVRYVSNTLHITRTWVGGDKLSNLPHVMFSLPAHNKQEGSERWR